MENLEEIKRGLKSIKTKKQYLNYLKIIDYLVDCEESSPEEETLKQISILVEKYELKHYPIETPNPH